MKVTDRLHAFLWENPTTNNCNSYFLEGKEKGILIDPGHDHLFEHVKEGLSRISFSEEDINLVIITHSHPDHIEGVKRFADSPCLIAVPALEMEFLDHAAFQYKEALGLSDFEPQILLGEGNLSVDDINLQVLHTPGHSPGSLCLYWPQKKVLFTGDLVFAQGVGRTDVPGGDGGQLKESIRRIGGLEVDYLLPGHGNLIIGRDRVEANFREIEEFWFAYI